MQQFAFSWILKAAQYAMRDTIHLVLEWFRSLFRRQMVCVWIMKKDVPREVGELRENTDLFLKNSAHRSLQAFIAEKPLGATVFWTIRGAGKTYTLAHMERTHRFVYVDWSRLKEGDAKEMFYREMGLNSSKETAPFGTYLPNDLGVFTTFVFDHFDCVKDNALVADLSKDSVKSQIPYNLLIMVNDPVRANEILSVHGWENQGMYTRLLGPPYCGHWFSRDLEQYSDERYNALVDQSGTLKPVLSIRNGLSLHDDPAQWLRATKAKEAWDYGERVLRQFRSLEV